jgi:hypothetical protein
VKLGAAWQARQFPIFPAATSAGEAVGGVEGSVRNILRPSSS